MVVGLLPAGPGSGLSEVPVWGCEPVALESEFPALLGKAAAGSSVVEVHGGKFVAVTQTLLVSGFASVSRPSRRRKSAFRYTCEIGTAETF